MLQALLSLDSARWVLLKHLADQVFGGIRDRVPVCRVKGKGLLQHISENFLVVVALERWVAAEENEKDDSERPDVARLVVVAFEDFWSDVVRCSNDRMHALNSLFL